LIAQRLAEWGEIASFLRRNVVQGTMDESGSYSESPPSVLVVCEHGEKTPVRLFHQGQPVPLPGFTR
jgi:hypothetical protein